MKNGCMGVLAVAVVAFAICPVLRGATLYTVTLLPPLAENTQNEGQGISSAGVAGNSIVDGIIYPAIWQGGKVSLLPVPAGYHGDARSINSSGDSVGAVLAIGAYNTQPSLWHNGQFQLLDTPAGLGGEAYAINDYGVIVGTLNDFQSRSFQAAMWTGGQMTILGNFPNMQATAVSVNNHGQVLIDADSTSWVWSNGSLITIPSIGGTAVVGRDINNSGAVAGELTITNGTAVTSAFIFKAGATELLPVLGDDQFTDARAINDSEIVVGDGYSATAGGHALVWQDGQVYDLNSLIPAESGWTLLSALDVGNDGTIVGDGNYLGQTQAFELTPAGLSSGAAVPEAGTVGVMVLGGVVLLRRRSK